MEGKRTRGNGILYKRRRDGWWEKKREEEGSRSVGAGQAFGAGLSRRVVERRGG